MKKLFKLCMISALAAVMGVTFMAAVACSDDSSGGNSGNSGNGGSNSGDDSQATTYTVTFDENYTGGAKNSETVDAGESVQRPDDPERSGYVFGDWYEVAEVGDDDAPYAFESPVTQDMTLYAQWYEEGTVLHTVTYHYNAEEMSDRTSRVEDRTRLTTPRLEREGYVLLGWYRDEDFAQSFSSGTRVTDDIDLYACWGKIYVLEAEYVDLSNFRGQGFSGGCDGAGALFQDRSNLGASNGYYMSYMYQNGLSIEFSFTSDVAVTNAQLVMRLNCEQMDIELTSSDFTVALNGTTLSYSNISLTRDQAFADYTVSTSCNLRAGANTIRLTTSNNTAMAGTMYATAPQIDCLKLVSYSNVVMDEHRENLDRFSQD